MQLPLSAINVPVLISGVCKYYIGPIGPSASSATCLCRLPQPPARNRPSMYSLHRNDMANCHFELCRDCGIGCFNGVVWYTVAVGVGGGVLVSNNCFFNNKTQFALSHWNKVPKVTLLCLTLLCNTAASLLELYFNDSMQTVYVCGGGGGSQQRRVADWADVVFRDTD